MLVALYKSKSELKAHVGEPLRHEETSMFAPEYTPDGRFAVVGPAALDRRFFAEVTMQAGKIKQVR